MSVAELPVVQMPTAEFVVAAPAPVLPAPLNDDEMNLACLRRQVDPDSGLRPGRGAAFRHGLLPLRKWRHFQEPYRTQ